MILVQKAIVKDKNNFLIILRSPSAKFFPEHWDFPGGKLEPNEEPFAGIEREVIEEVLRWSKGKNKFLVHCWAGISRSAAIAYLIACSKMPVTDAVKILNPKQHKPNRLILKFGEEILRKNNIIETFELHNENFQNPKRHSVTAGSTFRALKNLFM